MSLLQKLDQIVARHAELQAALSGGNLDSQKFVAASKEYADLGPLVEAVNEWRKAERSSRTPRRMAADPDMKAMAEEEAAALKKRLPELEQAVKRMLLPKDAADEKNAILEIRAGTGGDEAALFAADLFRMYQRYAAEHGWKFEIMELSDTGIGGYKEAIATVSGTRRVRPAEVRIGRAPRAARAGDRGLGPHPHLGGDRRGAAGGRGGRRQDRREGPAHRRLPRLGPGRPVGQHDRLGGAHHPHPDRRRGQPAGREEPAQEQGQGDEDPARPAVRRRAPAPRRCARRRPQGPGRHAAIAASASAPTTSRRAASPTIASTSRSTSSTEVLEGRGLDEIIDALIADDEASRLAELAA